MNIKFQEWWEQNASRFIQNIDLLAEEGCFKNTSTNDAIVELASTVVDDIYSSPNTDILNCSMIALQYLYEKYNIAPEDCEIFGQIISIGLNNLLKSTTMSTVEAVLHNIFGNFDVKFRKPNEPKVEQDSVGIDDYVHKALNPSFYVYSDKNGKIVSQMYIFKKDAKVKLFPPMFDALRMTKTAFVQDFSKSAEYQDIENELKENYQFAFITEETLHEIQSMCNRYLYSYIVTKYGSIGDMEAWFIRTTLSNMKQ